MTFNVSESYDVQKDEWYSPIDIINRINQVQSNYGVNYFKPEFKKAREMFTAAIALLGIYELSSENKYWLQLNRQSNSPDVVTAKQTEREGESILLELVQIEIVEFEKHFPSDDIIEFLKKTKLSNKKSYDKNTLILCVINRDISINYKEISEKLKEISPKSTIYISCRPDQEPPGVFSICSPYPKLTKTVIYNVYSVAKKYLIPNRIRLHRGIEEKISYDATRLEVINTYKVLGIDGDLVIKKYL